MTVLGSLLLSPVVSSAGNVTISEQYPYWDETVTITYTVDSSQYSYSKCYMSNDHVLEITTTQINHAASIWQESKSTTSDTYQFDLDLAPFKTASGNFYCNETEANTYTCLIACGSWTPSSPTYIIADYATLAFYPSENPCEEDIILDSMTFSSNASYEATYSISSANSSVQSGVELQLSAPTVILEDGFTVEDGGTLTISDEPCQG